MITRQQWLAFIAECQRMRDYTGEPVDLSPPSSPFEPVHPTFPEYDPERHTIKMGEAPPPGTIVVYDEVDHPPTPEELRAIMAKFGIEKPDCTPIEPGPHGKSLIYKIWKERQDAEPEGIVPRPPR